MSFIYKYTVTYDKNQEDFFLLLFTDYKKNFIPYIKKMKKKMKLYKYFNAVNKCNIALKQIKKRSSLLYTILKR